MSYTSRLVVVVCILLCLAVTAPAWAQGGSSTVYFSTGHTNPSQVYSLDTISGATNLLVSTSGADYEGLVVLPDNTGTYPYLVYACNTAGDQIVRFNPAAATPITPEVVYSGQGLYPQCGRGTSKGDLIFSSTAKGKSGGWWELAGIAGYGLGSKTLPSATQLYQPAANSSSLDEGMAMKNIGDLLIVDQANNQILRSAGPISSQFLAPGSTYTTASTFITGLTSPLGIARDVSGELFVSNQTRKPFVTKFDVNGQNPITCTQFGNKNSIGFLQSSLDSTVWVADTTQNGTGEILGLNASDCSVADTFTFSPPAVGLALPPTSTTVTGTSNDNGVTWALTLGDSAVLDVVTGGSCSATPYATAMQTSPVGLAGSGAISDLISQIPLQNTNSPYIPPENGLPNTGVSTGAPAATPAVDLWADGFETVFEAHFSGPSDTYPSCSQVSGNAGYDETLSSFVDPGVVTSGTVAYCDSSLATGCDTVDLFGAYPYGGLLPADYSGSGRTNSKFFVINATPSQTGQFCGYQSPLNGPLPTGIAGIFSSGSTISVKFKLATAGGNCKSANAANYITNAVALISVAQLCTPGSGGADLICSPNSQVALPQSNFVALVPEGNSTQTPPEFKYGNNQYQFSLSLKGYPPGIYSLTTTFLSGETTDQTVLFQVQ